MINFKLGHGIRKMNLLNVTGSLATSLPVAQWVQRPTVVWRVMGSIPVGDSDFSFSSNTCVSACCLAKTLLLL